MRVLALIALVGGSLAAFESTAVARECPDPSTPIETDRPDVTNSSIVVPVGSLQNENGIDLQRKDAAQALSGTNSRWRLGILARNEDGGNGGDGRDAEQQEDCAGTKKR